MSSRSRCASSAATARRRRPTRSPPRWTRTKGRKGAGKPSPLKTPRRRGATLCPGSRFPRTRGRRGAPAKGSSLLSARPRLGNDARKTVTSRATATRSIYARELRTATAAETKTKTRKARRTRTRRTERKKTRRAETTSHSPRRKNQNQNQKETSPRRRRRPGASPRCGGSSRRVPSGRAPRGPRNRRSRRSRLRGDAKSLKKIAKRRNRDRRLPPLPVLVFAPRAPPALARVTAPPAGWVPLRGAARRLWRPTRTLPGSRCTRLRSTATWTRSAPQSSPRSRRLGLFLWRTPDLVIRRTPLWWLWTRAATPPRTSPCSAATRARWRCSWTTRRAISRWTRARRAGGR